MAVYARAPKGIFQSALDEPNGHTVNPSQPIADVTVLDMTVARVAPLPEHADGRVVEPG